MMPTINKSFPLEDRIDYPLHPTKWSKEAFDALPSYRKVQNRGKPKTYTWKDTTYTFESSAEKRMFIWLAKVLNPQAMKIQSFQIKRKKPHRHYTPDFQILLQDGTFLLVEVKSILDHLDASVQQTYALLKTYGAKHGMATLWVDPHRHTFTYYLSSKPLNMPSVQPFILPLFESKEITKRQYDQAMTRYNPEKNRELKRKFDRYLVAYALQHGYGLNQSYRKGDWSLLQQKNVA